MIESLRRQNSPPVSVYFIHLVVIVDLLVLPSWVELCNNLNLI